MADEPCRCEQQGRCDDLTSLVVTIPAAPGHHVQLWPVQPFDALRFRHVGTSYDALKLYQARRAVNARKFHGWNTGVLRLDRIAVRPTDRTRHKLPLYEIDSTITIACLAGQADVVCTACPCGCGRLIRTRVAGRLDFNALPLGQPWHCRGERREPRGESGERIV